MVGRALHRVWTLVTEQVVVTSQLLLPVLLRHHVAKDAVVAVDLVCTRELCSPCVNRQHRGDRVECGGTALQFVNLIPRTTKHFKVKELPLPAGPR